MNAFTGQGFGVAALQQLQARFLSILPKIRTHARIYFRHVKCQFRKADFIAEVIALAWKWFLRLAQRGKDATRFPSVLATFAAKAVRCGRRITGQLSPRTFTANKPSIARASRSPSCPTSARCPRTPWPKR